MVSVTPSPIEALPVELRQRIMEHLPGAKSLLALTSTCKAMRDVYNASPGLIAHAIIRAEVPSNVWILALACYTGNERARGLPRSTAECVVYQQRVIDFYKENFIGPQQATLIPPKAFTLQMIQEMSSLHKIILDIADRCVAPELGAVASQCPPLNPLEKSWVVKAVYLFQLIHCLVPWDFLSLKQSRYLCLLKVFWKFFRPWECRQTRYIESQLQAQLRNRFFDLNFTKQERLGVKVMDIMQALHPLYFGVRQLHELFDTHRDRTATYPWLRATLNLARNAYRFDYYKSVSPVSRNYQAQFLRSSVASNGQKVWSLDIDHIGNARLEDGEDGGPRDAWWFNVVGMYRGYPGAAEDLARWIDSQESGRNHHYFWSRSRWDAQARRKPDGRLPTVEELQEKTAGKWIDSDVVS